MKAERLPDGFSVPRHDVQHAFRDARFQGQLAEPERRQGGLFRRLQDDAVSGRQCRADFPDGHQQGEIPRDDGPDDPKRFMLDKTEGVVIGGRDFAVNLVGCFGKPGQCVAGRGDIYAARIVYGFAYAECFQQCQFFSMIAHKAGEAHKGGLAFRRRDPGPCPRLEGAARRLYSKVDVFRPAVGYVDMGLPRRRVDHVERLARE